MFAPFKCQRAWYIILIFSKISVPNNSAYSFTVSWSCLRWPCLSRTHDPWNNHPQAYENCTLFVASLKSDSYGSWFVRIGHVFLLSPKPHTISRRASAIPAHINVCDVGKILLDTWRSLVTRFPHIINTYAVEGITYAVILVQNKRKP